MMIVSAANVYYNNYVSRVHWLRVAIISALVACTRSLTLYAVIFCPGLQSFFCLGGNSNDERKMSRLYVVTCCKLLFLFCSFVTNGIHLPTGGVLLVFSYLYSSAQTQYAISSVNLSRHWLMTLIWRARFFMRTGLVRFKKYNCG